MPGDIVVNIQVDPMRIFDSLRDVAQTIYDNRNGREGFVKSLRNEYFYKNNKKFNVMVFNLGIKYAENIQPNDLIAYANVTARFGFEKITYGIWVFRKGEFWKYGDGGFINWAFEGLKWERTPSDGGYVKFYEVSCWQCYLQKNSEYAGQDVHIWWGHTSEDAKWACDNWCERCKREGGCFAWQE